MSEVSEGRAPARRPPGPHRRYNEALGSVICERIAAGETLGEVCQDEGMPHRSSVRTRIRTHPEFGARMAKARAAGRHNPGGGRRATYDPQVGALICRRLVEGMTLRQACDLPGMPWDTTVLAWVERYPEFGKAYAQARLWQAHRRYDQVWETAEAATPTDAYAARVKIEALKWLAAKMAPKRYGPSPEDDPGGDGRPKINIYLQQFETGEILDGPREG